MKNKRRLDYIVIEKGFAKDKEEARALIMAGKICVNGFSNYKAGTLIPSSASIRLKKDPPYVGRGGYKLAHALDVFNLDVKDKICIDVGASIGGFTDVLLQRGCSRVFSIDVGYGILDWKLRNDDRVVVMERTNIRHLKSLPYGVRAHCGVVDVSFISLKLVLPRMKELIQDDGWIVGLIKPQFEARYEQVEKGGLIKDPNIHREVLYNILNYSISKSFYPKGLIRSPIKGDSGNIEFLVYLDRNRNSSKIGFDINKTISSLI